jgi:hypothetical protein
MSNAKHSSNLILSYSHVTKLSDFSAILSPSTPQRTQGQASSGQAASNRWRTFRIARVPPFRQEDGGQVRLIVGTPLSPSVAGLRRVSRTLRDTAGRAGELPRPPGMHSFHQFNVAARLIILQGSHVTSFVNRINPRCSSGYN